MRSSATPTRSTACYGVMDKRLADREFVAGAYSVADIAIYPWVVAARERLLTEAGAFPHVGRWIDTIAARPAVVRAYAIHTEAQSAGMDDEARKHLFGDSSKP